MSTFVEDMRVALAEIAPHLAAVVEVPNREHSWSYWRAPRWISFEDFVLIRRARHLVGLKHGRPTTNCDACAWAVFHNEDYELAEYLVRNGCPHMGDQP